MSCKQKFAALGSGSLQDQQLALVSHKLSKNFVSYKKPPGLVASLRSLFVREALVKSAVDSFDVEIPKGQIVGLLGPNGAGKTTLMKMWTGIIVPTSGHVEVLGHQPYQRSEQYRRKISLVMGQKSQLWWDIPAMDSFELLQRYYEVPSAKFKDRIAELSELLAVKDLLHVHVRKLSLGERMKLELMASLLHEPEILFLDEPTIGLDIVAQQKIREFIRKYHDQRQLTILLTSHYMADVEALCERLVLILAGKKRFDGTVEQFQGLLGKKRFVKFRFSEPLPENIQFSDYDPQWGPERRTVDLRIDEADLRTVAGQILKDYPVMDFQTEPMPIERVMHRLLEDPQLLSGADS